MFGQRHQLTKMQSDFYKDWYHKILYLLMGFSVMILCLILVIIYLILVKQNQKYYATTTEGQIIEMSPMKATR
jgi:hypothetical protein